MMAFLKRAFSSRVDPVTHLDVDPAPGNPEKEREIISVLGQMAHTVINSERKAWEIREELAGNVLKIVSGGGKTSENAYPK